MALPATAVWEVRTAGSDTNGGGFDPAISGAGTDYSQQNSKNTIGNNISTTDVVANGTVNLLSVTAAFTSALIGNVIYLAGGSGSLTGSWYEVEAVTSASAIVVGDSVPAGTGIAMNIGGALASPGQASGAAVAGNDVWVKAGTYSITSASANVAAGCVDLTGTGGTGKTNVMHWEGYQTTRGDLGTKPVLQASGITNAVLFEAGSQFSVVRNLTFDGNGQTDLTGYRADNSYVRAIDCRAINCTTIGLLAGGTSTDLTRCSASGCSNSYPQGAIELGGGATAFGCYVDTTTGYAYSLGNMARAEFCIATGASAAGFLGISVGYGAVNCVAYACAGGGFDCTGNNGFFQSLINCIAEGNTGEGFVTDSVADGTWLFNCAGYNNSSGNYNSTNLPNVEGFVTGSASFFTNPGAGDFSLNNTSGGGASARAAGIPGVFPGGTSTGFLDIGAVQHLVMIIVGGLHRLLTLGAG